MLAVGETIDHYRVTAILGRGGMGEVYQARDEQLGRLVAIKILLSEVTHLPKRRARFLQEARAASALNHPNIVTVYALGLAGSRDYIAMEYVAGHSLAALINQRALSIESVLDYATQLASALEAAHHAGIIHRDLKPSNIMLADSGLIKVLDFGLAKLIEPLSGNPSDATMTLAPGARTEVGAVLGTLAYMSPEQLETKPVDARSDIFSFGVVLYEMTVGRAAFGGGSQAKTVTAIMRDQPAPVNQVRPEAPPRLAELIHRCLAKDPAERIQSMTGILEILGGGRVQSPRVSRVSALLSSSPAQPVQRRRARWIAGSAVLLLGVSAGTWWALNPRDGRNVPPRLVPLTSHGGQQNRPALSPSGNLVAFSWDEGAAGPMRLFVKQVGQPSQVRLTAGPNADTDPAWSPDETLIAFHRLGAAGVRGIYVIPALGGAARKIAGVSDAGGTLTWAPDGNHLAVSDTPDDPGKPGPTRLYLVSVATGARRPLTSPPREILGDQHPAYSPDGKLLAFGRIRTATIGHLYVMPAAGGDAHPVAVDPRAILPNGGMMTPEAGFAWTPDSRELIFAARRGGADRLWRIRVSGGNPEVVSAAGDNAESPSISRRGDRLVYIRKYLDTDIWRAGLTAAGKIADRPAKFMASTRIDTSPEYSPDGSKILFYSQRSGAAEIWVADSEGRNPIQITSRGGGEQNYPRWSPDGQWIAFGSPAAGNWDIYRVAATGGASRQLTSDPSDDYRPNWSHDGQWLYFISGRGGGNNLWKMPAAGGAAVQVTREGATSAEQSADGKFLYITRRQAVWRMPVDRESEAEKVFEPERPIAWGTWILAPKGIYYFTPSPASRPTLNFFRFETRRKELVVQAEKQIRQPGRRLALSPDSRWLLFEQVEETPSELIMVSNFR